MVWNFMHRRKIRSGHVPSPNEKFFFITNHEKKAVLALVHRGPRHTTVVTVFSRHEGDQGW